MIPSINVRIKGALPPKPGDVIKCIDASSNTGQKPVLLIGKEYVCQFVVGNHAHVVDEDGPMNKPFRLDRFRPVRCRRGTRKTV